MQSMAQKMKPSPNRCQNRTQWSSRSQRSKIVPPPGKVSKRGTLSFVSKGHDLMRKPYSSGFGLSGASLQSSSTKQPNPTFSGPSVQMGSFLAVICSSCSPKFSHKATLRASVNIYSGLWTASKDGGGRALTLTWQIMKVLSVALIL